MCVSRSSKQASKQISRNNTNARLLFAHPQHRNFFDEMRDRASREHLRLRTVLVSDRRISRTVLMWVMAFHGPANLSAYISSNISSNISSPIDDLLYISLTSLMTEPRMPPKRTAHASAQHDAELESILTARRSAISPPSRHCHTP